MSVHLSRSTEASVEPVSSGFTIAQRNRLFIISCLLPATIALVAIIAYPFFYGVYLSLTDANPLTLQQHFIGFDNYRTMINDDVFRNSFRLTVIYSLVSVGIEFPLAMALALMLNEPLRGRVVYRALLLVPWVMPNVVAAIIWQWIYSPDFGLLNYALVKLHIIDRYIDFLGDPNRALSSVIVINIWKGLPFSAVVLLAGLQAVPGDLHEAATIDGAGAWRRFRDVTVPHLMPIITIVLILRIVWTFNSFDLVYVLTGGGPGWATQLLSIYVYLSSFQYQQLGYGAAMAVAMVIALSIPVGLFVRRTLRNQESA